MAKSLYEVPGWGAGGNGSAPFSTYQEIHQLASTGDFCWSTEPSDVILEAAFPLACYKTKKGPPMYVMEMQVILLLVLSCHVLAWVTRPHGKAIYI